MDMKETSCEVQIGTCTLCNLHVEMKMAHLLLMLDWRKQVRNSNYIKEVTTSTSKKKEKPPLQLFYRIEDVIVLILCRN